MLLHTGDKWEDKTNGEKVWAYNYDIHTGAIVGKTIAFFLILFSASLPVTRLIIWYGRYKKKRKLKKKNQSGLLTLSNANRQMKRKRPVIKAQKKNRAPALTIKSSIDDY
ncbi:MAG: hypothetical protein AAGI25_10435 [Bacteroidota bacterium]